MTIKTHKFKTLQEQIAFENTLPDNACYDSLSDPINKDYKTIVKVKEIECPRCKGAGKVKQ